MNKDANKTKEQLISELKELRIRSKEQENKLKAANQQLNTKVLQRTKELKQSEHHYQMLFNESPVPIWEEDFSQCKTFIDSLKKRNIKNFREYFEKNPEKIIEISKKVKIIDINKATVKLHEAHSKQEILYSLSSIFTDKSYKTFTEQLICIAEGKNEYESEAVVKTIAGLEKNILLKWTVVPGYEDTFEKIYVTTTDITERKQAEDQLKQSEDRLTKTMMAANDGMWDWDLKTNEVYFDARYYQMAAYDVNEFPHRLEEFQKRIHPEDVDYVMNEAQKHLEGKIERFIVEFRFKKKNGDWLWVMGRGIIVERDKNNAPLRFIGTHTDISKRKQAEEKLNGLNQQFEANNQQLQATEQQLRATNQQLTSSETKFKKLSLLKKSILDSPQGIVVFALDKNYCYLDFTLTHKQTMKAIWGVDIEIGSNMLNYIKFKLDREKAKKNFDKALKGEQFVFYEKYGDKNLNRTFYENRYNPIYDEKNNIIGLSVYVIDITERKQAEEALKENELRLKSLINATPDIICFKDGKGRWLIANDADIELFNLQNTDYFGKTDAELAEFTAPIYKESFLLCMETDEKSWQSKTLSQNNEIIPTVNGTKKVYDVIKVPLFEPDGARKGLVVLGRDITERKQAEEALRKSEAIKNNMLSNIGDVIVIIDKNGIIQYKSPNVTKQFGWAPEERVGKSTWDNVHPEDLDATQKFVGTIATVTNASGTSELRYKHKDGHYVWIEITVVNLLHDNDIHGFLGNYHDISERKKAEQELTLAKEKAEESDRLKSAFLANMSHEIRTPMNGILGFTQLLKNTQLSGDKKERYIELIEKSGNRMLKTINDIIDISKIEAGQIKVEETEVSVNEILAEQYNFFYHQAIAKGLELNYKPSLTDSESHIITDPQKLEGILTNLLRNAIKFTNTGEIRFGYRLKDKADGKFIEFYVKDTGIGIPTNRVEAIFNRFEQADIEDKSVFEGSGLGLTISKSYVEMLGGEISVKSQKGEGSTFTFSIPYNRQNLT